GGGGGVGGEGGGEGGGGEEERYGGANGAGESQGLPVGKPAVGEPAIAEGTVGETAVAETAIAEWTVEETTVAEATVAEWTVAKANAREVEELSVRFTGRAEATCIQLRGPRLDIEIGWLGVFGGAGRRKGRAGEYNRAHG